MDQIMKSFFKYIGLFILGAFLVMVLGVMVGAFFVGRFLDVKNQPAAAQLDTIHQQDLGYVRDWVENERSPTDLDVSTNLIAVLQRADEDDFQLAYPAGGSFHQGNFVIINQAGSGRVTLNSESYKSHIRVIEKEGTAYWVYFHWRHISNATENFNEERIQPTNGGTGQPKP
jgi:hypothetical protein